MWADPYFLAIEDSAFSVWIRESFSVFAFPMILTVHTLCMGLLAGTNAAIDARILGLARSVPLSAMEKFFPVMWVSFWVNAVTGVVLVIAYPTKALTNPVFGIKLGLIAAAVAQIPAIRRYVTSGAGDDGGTSPSSIRIVAIISLVSWAGALITGRLLAYTYTRLLV
jgi:hypothetical protein